MTDQNSRAPAVPGSAATWREDSRSRPDTIARLEKVLELLAVHGFVEPACRQAHCSKDTYYEFRRRFDDFADEADRAIDRARTELEATGWACARKAINDPRYLSALIFALKAKVGWRESSHLDLTSGGNALPDPRDLSDEELVALIEQSRKVLPADDE